MADSVSGLCTQLDSLLLDQPYLGMMHPHFIIRTMVVHRRNIVQMAPRSGSAFLYLRIKFLIRIRDAEENVKLGEINANSQKELGTLK